MNGWSRVAAVAGAGFLVCLSSCIMVRADHLESPRPFETTSSHLPKPSLSVLVALDGWHNGTQMDSLAWMLNRYRENTIEALRSSDLFGEISDDPAASDLRVEIRFQEKEDDIFILWGFTGFVLPTYGDTDLTISATFRDRSGAELGVYTASESVTLWVSLLLTPVMPFFWPGSVFDSVFSDLVNTTLREALADGVFGTAAAL